MVVSVECPNHEGAFDCTPFCVICEGNQECVPESRLETVFNLWDADEYGDGSSGGGFKLTAYNRVDGLIQTDRFKSVSLLPDEVPASIEQVDDDWFGESDPLFVELLCLFTWKLVQEEGSK